MEAKGWVGEKVGEWGRGEGARGGRGGGGEREGRRLVEEANVVGEGG